MSSVEAYPALVERLEQEAAVFPARYKWKVGLLAALWFAVLGGAVLLAFGVSAGLVAVLAAISPILLLKLAKLLWIPVALGWLVLRALWVKFAPPHGEPLQPADAPVLHAEIERLRESAGAPRLAGVLVDADFNAAAASVPRALGLLGHRHYLVLGLPLMQALSREQFLAVLAHEFGHFGGGHGRFSGWVYHVRLSWFRLLDALSAQGGWVARRFVAFFEWYAPYFNAYSFVLSRANEYQADATAARLVSPEAMGEALVRTRLAGQRLEGEFWPGVDAMTRSQPAPPDALYGRMRSCLLAADDHPGEGLARALSRRSDPGDTHPSLSQRLAALAQNARVPSAPTESAAQALLGESLAARLEERFSRDWQQGIGEAWQQRYQAHAQAVERLAELRRRDDATAEEVVERARLQEDLEPETDAVQLYREALERAPESAIAHYRLGVLLLEREDHAGVAHLERALELEPEAGGIVLEQLDMYYRRMGDHAGIDTTGRRMRGLRAALGEEARARGDVGLRDVFEAHGLDEAALRGAVRALASAGSVGKAWIVRKRLPAGASSVPHHVVLVQWRGFLRSEQRALQRVVDALELPGSLIVVSARNRRMVSRRIRKVAGVPAYRHGMGD